MTIGFILNGEDVTIQTPIDRRLVDILRDTFNLTGTHTGCRIGCCGSCFIIFNGKVIPSCQIPAFKVRGGEIITIEGFMQTNEYEDIRKGFARSGITMCGFCTTAKILITDALLQQSVQPDKITILEAFSSIRCRCTEPNQLIEGVLAASEIRQRRIYGRTH
jgi:carbon-monoxide dehydrogenase small subunit